MAYFAATLPGLSVAYYGKGGKARKRALAARILQQQMARAGSGTQGLGELFYLFGVRNRFSEPFYARDEIVQLQKEAAAIKAFNAAVNAAYNAVIKGIPEETAPETIRPFMPYMREFLQKQQDMNFVQELLTKGGSSYWMLDIPSEKIRSWLKNTGFSDSVIKGVIVQKKHFEQSLKPLQREVYEITGKEVALPILWDWVRGRHKLVSGLSLDDYSQIAQLARTQNIPLKAAYQKLVDYKINTMKEKLEQEKLRTKNLEQSLTNKSAQNRLAWLDAAQSLANNILNWRIKQQALESKQQQQEQRTIPQELESYLREDANKSGKSIVNTLSNINDLPNVLIRQAQSAIYNFARKNKLPLTPQQINSAAQHIARQIYLPAAIPYLENRIIKTLNDSETEYSKDDVKFNLARITDPTRKYRALTQIYNKDADTAFNITNTMQNSRTVEDLIQAGQQLNQQGRNPLMSLFTPTTQPATQPQLQQPQQQFNYMGILQNILPKLRNLLQQPQIQQPVPVPQNNAQIQQGLLNLQQQNPDWLNMRLRLTP